VSAAAVVAAIERAGFPIFEISHPVGRCWATTCPLHPEHVTRLPVRVVLVNSGRVMLTGQSGCCTTAILLERFGLTDADLGPDDGTEVALSGEEDLTPDAAEPVAPALVFQTFGDLAAEVDALGPRRFLIRGMWPAGDYGVHAAEAKAGKSWNATDLVVSVASGTPWLGRFEIDDPGPAVMFVGEGSKANTVRRIRAVAAARGVQAETLPITVCVRAPHLDNRAHLAAIADELERSRPTLVTLDPLYLSAGGGDGRSLYSMGALLEGVQLVVQRTGASLFVVTHFNKTGTGTGADRITGTGPAEWGRVLVTAAVKSRHTDPVTAETRVLTAFEVRGGEVPDLSFRVTRRIRSDDPDSLDAALHVTVTVEDGEDPAGSGSGPAVSLSPAETKILEALDSADGATMTNRQIVDSIAATHGHGLRRETVSKALSKLAGMGVVDGLAGAGAFTETQWFRLPDAPRDQRDVTRDGHTGEPSCDPCDPPVGGHAVTSHGDGHTGDLEGEGHTVAVIHACSGATCRTVGCTAAAAASPVLAAVAEPGGAR
jgi:hypothetical protein